jgi:GT2 family glycosyltransferase
MENIVTAGYDKECEIIVVNKPSSDKIENILPKKYTFAKFISYPYFNVGGMRNIGIKNSDKNYVVMLDSDTTFTEDRFEKIIDFFNSTPNAAVVGCKLLNQDLTLQYSCRTFYDLTTVIYRRTPLATIFPNSRVIRKHLMKDYDHNTIREVDWVQGACFFIRKKVLQDIGYFKDVTAFGFEDVDFCYRAKQKEWKVYYYPHVKIIHEYQKSSRNIFSKRAMEHLIAGIKFYLIHHWRK